MTDTPETLENEIAASEQTFEKAVEAALEKDAAPLEPEPEKVAGEVYDEETRLLVSRLTALDAALAESSSAEIVPYEEPLERHDRGSLTLFGTDDPAEVVIRATKIADALADVIRKQGLASRIGDREYVRVEGWTFLGTMLGVFPVTAWTRRIEGQDGGWEARVEAVTKDGITIGAAEAECLRTERTWAKRDDYALRSMAATRATSKALRMPLGFVMTLAGFEATPADEMTDTTVTTPAAKPARTPAEASGKAQDATKPAEATPETASVEQLDELRAALKTLEGVRGWSEKEVVTQAAKVFRPGIKKLADLTPDEAADITKAAKAAAA